MSFEQQPKARGVCLMASGGLVRGKAKSSVTGVFPVGVCVSLCRRVEKRLAG